MPMVVTAMSLTMFDDVCGGGGLGCDELYPNVSDVVCTWVPINLSFRAHKKRFDNIFHPDIDHLSASGY